MCLAYDNKENFGLECAINSSYTTDGGELGLAPGTGCVHFCCLKRCVRHCLLSKSPPMTFLSPVSAKY